MARTLTLVQPTPALDITEIHELVSALISDLLEAKDRQRVVVYAAQQVKPHGIYDRILTPSEFSKKLPSMDVSPISIDDAEGLPHVRAICEKLSFMPHVRKRFARTITESMSGNSVTETSLSTAINKFIRMHPPPLRRL